MSEQSQGSRFNFSNAKIEVVQPIETNHGTVIGKQVSAPEQNFEPALEEIRQILAKLQQHTVTTETEVNNIIDAEFTEIKNKQPNKWRTLKRQLLNPERWLNGGKAAVSEVAKHYLNDSLPAKATIAFLDGLSADEVD